jgi:hypothetical protein
MESVRRATNRKGAPEHRLQEAKGIFEGQTWIMSERTELAKAALSIVDGVTQSAPDAEALITSAFDDPDLAAHSYAYLCGFILQVLGSERFGGSTAMATSEVRRLLDRLE